MVDEHEVRKDDIDVRIESISKINLKENDILIIKPTRFISPTAHEIIYSNFKRALAESGFQNEVIVCFDELNISVISHE